MRVFKIAFVAIVSVLCFVIASYGADIKIGIVDVQKVLEESSAGKLAKEDLKKQKKRMEDELKRKGSELEAIKEKLEREAMVMSREKREEKERDYRIKVGDFKALQRRYTEELREHESNLLKQFQDNIFKLVREVGKDEGYTLIIDKLGVLYSPNSVDITDKLIKLYNIKFGK